MEGLDIVAKLMAISARTAPKSKGEDFVQTRVLEGHVLQKLAAAMDEYGRRSGKRDFDRDARGIGHCGAVLLVGIKDAKPVGLNCGACGFEECKKLVEQQKTGGEFKGPWCAFRLLDMGIALGSAVKTASMHNVDNRIMYRVGMIVRRMGLVEWDVVMGIPLSASGKNIFFDR
ncbi:MAG: ferredoxin domain-containing protein [Desulfatibacillaceae bacterium]